MDEKTTALTLIGFSRLEISGVTEVLAFDEQHVELSLENNVFLVGGADLVIESFSRETGRAAITGRIDSFFKEEEPVRKTGFLSRFFS